MDMFRKLPRANKGIVMNNFEQSIDAKNADGSCLCNPTLLQIVYEGGARQHVVLNRYVARFEYFLTPAYTIFIRHTLIWG